MPPNEPLARSANPSGLNFIGKAEHSEIYRQQRHTLLRCPGLGFIRTTQRQFHGRRNITAVDAPYERTIFGPPSRAHCTKPRPSAPSLAPDVPVRFPGKIDKSVLTLPEPKRRRDKSQLRFVASQPCLICGRHPSDPHHLRFAQPRALGLKVSDEFTVPLCRGHHRQLHQAGNEIAWWQGLKIDALHFARQLWEQTHSNEGQELTTVPQSEAAAKRMTTERQMAVNRESSSA